MAYFDDKKGIVLEDNDLKHQPLFKDKNDFLGWVMGKEPIKEPKKRKVDILK